MGTGLGCDRRSSASDSGLGAAGGDAELLLVLVVVGRAVLVEADARRRL